MKRITIYDVAKEADVSLATVSRVINDSNVVREDTRIRVQEAIEKLGYKPNAIAQGLALSKTTTISIVMSEKLFSYNSKILNGLMDVAKIYNYNIMLHTTSKGISKMQDVIESIVKSRVDGVILFNDNFSEEELEVPKAREWNWSIWMTLTASLNPATKAQSVWLTIQERCSWTGTAVPGLASCTVLTR